jgi:hypothetical protein
LEFVEQRRKGMNIVYPIGYSALGARERIDELLQQPQALLIDTRLKPYSWRVDWRQSEMKAKYGSKYRWAGKFLGNLGYNRNYIEIADPKTGIRGLVQYLSEGYNLILLCQCTDFEDCHVKEICRLLVEAQTEIEVVKFKAGQPQDTIPCFSVRPPYGTWLANPQRFRAAGVPPKTTENRDKDLTGGYRGPVLIHQSKTFEHEAFDHWSWEFGKLGNAVSPNEKDYPTGCIVGQAEIVDMVTKSYDPWFVGPCGIVLANARPIEPVPYRGQLGLFTVPKMIELAREVRA